MNSNKARASTFKSVRAITGKTTMSRNFVDNKTVNGRVANVVLSNKIQTNTTPRQNNTKNNNNNNNNKPNINIIKMKQDEQIKKEQLLKTKEEKEKEDSKIEIDMMRKKYMHEEEQRLKHDVGDINSIRHVYHKEAPIIGVDKDEIYKYLDEQLNRRLDAKLRQYGEPSLYIKHDDKKAYKEMKQKRHHAEYHKHIEPVEPREEKKDRELIEYSNDTTIDPNEEEPVVIDYKKEFEQITTLLKLVGSNYVKEKYNGKQIEQLEDIFSRVHEFVEKEFEDKKT